MCRSGERSGGTGGEEFDSVNSISVAEYFSSDALSVGVSLVRSAATNAGRPVKPGCVRAEICQRREQACRIAAWRVTRGH